MDNFNEKPFTGSAVNIDSLRDEYESNTEWRLRKKFLELNSNSFSLDRLICLSRCFVNMVIYGCSYPKEVMKVVHERSGGILSDMKSEKKFAAKQKYAASFVKASSNVENSSTENYTDAGTSNVIKKVILSSEHAGNEQSLPQVHKKLTENQTEAYAINRNIAAPQESNLNSSAVFDLGGYWTSIENLSENVADEKHTEKSKDVSLISTEFESLNPKTAVVNVRHDIQNLNVEKDSYKSDTQNPKTAVVNVRHDVQNLNVEKDSYKSDTQNPKTALIRDNQSPRTTLASNTQNVKIDFAGAENSKTVLGRARPCNQNPKTALISAVPSVKNSKIELISEGPDTQSLVTALSKEECLIAFQKESNPILKKIRKLAYEVQNLKVTNQNVKEKLNSAGNRVPVFIDFNIECIPSKSSSTFLCHLLIEGIEVASETGPSIKQAKTNVCEVALKVIMMPRIEIVRSSNEVQLLKGSVISQNQNLYQSSVAHPENYRHTSSEGSSREIKLLREETPSYKESNLSADLKRKWNHSKCLEEFIIVEYAHASSGGGASVILRQSADFNQMLLEYEYLNQSGATRCIVKIEGQIMADAVGCIKSDAKAAASAQCLKKLKNFCWVLKTKQAVDSNTRISKEEIQKTIQLESEKIGNDNIGNKLLQKMGWSGGGVGKYGTGIAEPLSLKSVLNREGLGLSTSGNTGNFKQRVREVLQTYAISGNQDDLVFSPEFDITERKVIHEEARKLNLRSTSRGKLKERYLCVSRKRSANQLFEHVMSCGGETAKYKLLPPGTDDSDQSEI